MRVLAWPAFKTRYKNPYNWLLYQPMAALGVTVEEFSPLRLLRHRYDVVHLHWPVETITRHPVGLVAWLRVQMFLFLLDWAKARGSRLVWTIHDDRPHVLLHPRLSCRCEAALVRRTDATIHLCEASRPSLAQRLPALAAKPQFVVPHGHYRSTYPNTASREVARDRFHLPPDALTLLYVGYISPYKNVPRLIEQFGQLAGDRLRLLVAGKPDTAALHTAIETAAAADPRVHTFLDYVENDDLQHWFGAADVVVLPFQEILNSGSAIMALSFDRPILAPGLGAMVELQQRIGADWVHTYTGDLTADTLAQAVAVAQQPPAAPAPLAALDWEALAAKTVHVYASVVQAD